MKITGYSTALFATWYFLEEHHLLFDAGDGLVAQLLQKSRSIKHVFISHADRDHLTGLLQFNQLNGRQGLKVYFPKDCGSFPALEDFSKKFDPHTTAMEWEAITPETEIQINKNHLVTPIENRHVINSDGRVKSMGYTLSRVKRKLREEFKTLSGPEIKDLREQLGDELTYEVREKLISYSGDTPVEYDGRWEDSKILIHEATFLKKEDLGADGKKRNLHSSLDEVIKMVAESNIEQLILGHFSSRFKAAEIDEAIQRECEKNKITIPVFRVLPGVCVKDILSGTAINN